MASASRATGIWLVALSLTMFTMHIDQFSVRQLSVWAVLTAAVIFAIAESFANRLRRAGTAFVWVVAILYWGLAWINPELVHPGGFEPPRFLNHCIHTFPALALLIDILASPCQRDNKEFGILLLPIAYSVWTIGLYFLLGSWPYGFLASGGGAARTVAAGALFSLTIGCGMAVDKIAMWSWTRQKLSGRIQ
jgi:hypothetical protein